MIRVVANKQTRCRLAVSCPVCHAGIIVSAMDKIDEGKTQQENKCPSCGAEWSATYTVTKGGKASCEFSGKWESRSLEGTGL